ncbi:unnamed protein product [Paramecium octaurelia]|uniref:C2 NT-type domain-containing protein n=1 Tax=Paramecium octaurelia TaxID=43137 RepID=A0A8S1T3V8_PAROT|nr:unnamed protein product [Paramecium octaurelia]
MKQILTYTIIFKKLQLSLNANIDFNIEIKSLDKNVSLLKYMKINHQYEQYMEVKCIVTKVNLKYEEKIRKLSIVLSDGKSKKIAGFVQFDLSVALNLNMRQKEYTLNLIQCPDTKAFVEFTLLINSLNFVNPDSDIDSMTSRALSQNESQEKRKIKVENAQLENELIKVKQDLQIVEAQYQFLGSQYKQLQIQLEEKTIENADLQYQVQQLCNLNTVCIEKIKYYEKLHSEQAQSQKQK